MDNTIEVHIWDSLDSFSKRQLECWQNFSHGNPFVHPNFFQALEDSKCIGKESGWNPLYFVALKNDQLKALMIGFVKTHSYGEYIFDWQWANTYDHYGMPYYPKLTMAIPHSPVSAPKFLGDFEISKNQLLPILANFSKKYHMSGMHFLFTNKEENHTLEELGFKIRDSLQYHWHNHGYESFNDYLAALKKNRRKSIKRERRQITEENLVIKRLKGSELNDSDIEFFYGCYQNTIDKKYSMGYLNHTFFKKLFQYFPEQTYLIIAYEGDVPIASSLFICSNDTLYGRYWGCTKDIEFLHFELCIYQGIELALEKGLSTFEAGAQGEHKRMRGFDPVLTKSAHFIQNPQFRKAINHFIDEEAQQLEEIKEELSQHNSLK